MPSSTLTLPTWLQAKNLQSVAVYGTSLVDGTGTWSTAVDLAVRPVGGVGTFEAFTVSRSRGLVEISPADSYVENYVDEKLSFDATLTEISSAKGSVLPAMANLYTYIMVIATYKAEGAVSGNTYCVAFVGIIDTHEFAIQTGKNTNSLTLRAAGKNVPFFGLLSALPSTFGA